VYGEVVDALHHGYTSGLDPSDDAWRIQCQLANYVAKNWRVPGAGIWEQRTEPRLYVHSIVMAWVALDRAVKTVQTFGVSGPVEHWKKLMAVIHEEVCRLGFSTRKNAFVQYFGSEALDASALLIPLVGFLPIDDPRIVGTVAAIQRELTEDGFVRRYIAHPEADGLSEGEGVFIACSLWLADNLALLGRQKEARDLFERVLALRNDVGLLAEEYDPRSRTQLGNFPQAFSHVGIINTVRNLTKYEGPARHRAEGKPEPATVSA
jgi:GH15 family glucan-1,4-alpha-glucosidase